LGPGRGLEQQWAGAAHIVATIVGGDNFVATRSAEAEPAIRAALQAHGPDVLVAGPAFNAGRYGLACGVACGVAAELGIPHVTAMYPENPGGALHPPDATILPTHPTAARTEATLPRPASLPRCPRHGDPD